MAAGKSAAAARGAWLVFEDEAGQSMRPPRARTWGRIGRTPIVRVRGRGAGRVSMAGLSCYKTGQRSRMFYSFHVYRGRRAGFARPQDQVAVVLPREALGLALASPVDTEPVDQHGNRQVLAYFVTSSPWSPAQVRAQLVWWMHEAVRPRALTVDGTGFLKDGDASACVSR